MSVSIIFYNIVLFTSMCVLYTSLYVSRVNLFRFFTFLILFIVSSLRINIGTDYISYQNIFEIIGGNVREVNTEPLFYLVNIIVAKLGLSFRGVIVITSLLFVLPLIKCSDKRITIWIVFYLLINYYLASFNAIRQGIALSISCYALYRLVYFENFKKYILFIIIAAGFHYSALIGLVLIFARKLVLPIWLNLAIIGLVYFGLSLFVPFILNSSFFLATKYALYADTGYIDGAKLGSGVGLFLQLLPHFIIIIFNRIIFDDVKVMRVAVNISLISIVVKMLVLHIGIFHRLEHALIFMLAVIFAEIARCSRRSYLNFGLFVYLLLWNVLQFELQLLNNFNEVIPYQTVFGSL